MLIRAKIDLENAEKEFAKLRHSNYALNIQKIPNEFFKTRAKLITRQQTAVAEIAKFTGGSTKYLEQTDSANQIYSQIFSEMNQRYIIGYYPINQERNGKHRNVVTEVRGHPKYKILGRKTYILT